MRRHSPYNYAFDNPIRFIDPDGMAPKGCCGGDPRQAVAQAQKAYTSAVQSVKSAWSNLTKGVSAKIEFTTSIGPQAGFKVGKAAEVDITVASIKLTTATTEIKDGKFTESRQLTDTKIDMTSGKKDEVSRPGAEVENKAALTIAGIGGEVGQSQKIDRDGNSTDYKTFVKTTGGKEGWGATSNTETTESGKQSTKTEGGFTIGAKFILGVEMSIKIEK